MKKKIRGQFAIVRASMKMIEKGRSSKWLRMNQQLVKVWNNTFKFLVDQADNEYDRAICMSLYGALNDKIAHELTWEQMKKLTESIMEGTLI